MSVKQTKTKYIDWNQLSELGLVERINTEILHPLGLAVARNPKTGHSEMILIAVDGSWCYPEDRVSTIKSDNEVRNKLKEMVDNGKYKEL